MFRLELYDCRFSDDFLRNEGITGRSGGGAVSLVVEVVEIVLRAVITHVAFEVQPVRCHEAQRPTTDEVIGLGNLVVVLQRVERVVVLRPGALKIGSDVETPLRIDGVEIDDRRRAGQTEECVSTIFRVEAIFLAAGEIAGE